MTINLNSKLNKSLTMSICKIEALVAMVTREIIRHLSSSLLPNKNLESICEDLPFERSTGWLLSWCLIWTIPFPVFDYNNPICWAASMNESITFQLSAVKRIMGVRFSLINMLLSSSKLCSVLFKFLFIFCWCSPFSNFFDL